MADILAYGAKPLRTRATLVESFDDSLWQLINKMRAIMEKANGVGLSANQIGDPRAVCVIAGPGPDALINPIILDGDDPYEVEEGCLSIPNYFSNIWRWKSIEGEAYNRYGGKMTFSSAGLGAQIIQHEVDHLEGIMFVDRLGFEKQDEFYKFWWSPE